MRVKRLVKERRQQGLTEARLEYLLNGYCFFDDAPFESEGEARKCWEEHAREIMERCDADPSILNFLPGTRPWAWWRFVRSQAPPAHQAAVLEKLGEFSEEERAEVLKLARGQWCRHTMGWTPEAKARAEKVTDDDIFTAWPGLP